MHCANSSALDPDFLILMQINLQRKPPPQRIVPSFYCCCVNCLALLPAQRWAQLICILIQSAAAHMTLQFDTRSLKYWLRFRPSNWIDLTVKSWLQTQSSPLCSPDFLFFWKQTIKRIHIKANTHRLHFPAQLKWILFILTVTSSAGFGSQSHRSVSQLCPQSLRLGGSKHCYAWSSTSVAPHLCTSFS